MEVKNDKLNSLYSPTESDDVQDQIQKSVKCQKFLKARSEYLNCCKSHEDAVKQLHNISNLNNNTSKEGSQTENIKSLELKIEKLEKNLQTLEGVCKNLYQIAENDVEGIKSQKLRYKIIEKKDN